MACVKIATEQLCYYGNQNFRHYDFTNKTDHNSCNIWEIGQKFLHLGRGLSGERILSCHLKFKHTDPRCHSNKNQDILEENSLYTIYTQKPLWLLSLVGD